METLYNAAASLLSGGTAAQSGQEPVSGHQGAGEGGAPFDAGNEEGQPAELNGTSPTEDRGGQSAMSTTKSGGLTISSSLANENKKSSSAYARSDSKASILSAEYTPMKGTEFQNKKDMMVASTLADTPSNSRHPSLAVPSTPAIPEGSEATIPASTGAHTEGGHLTLNTESAALKPRSGSAISADISPGSKFPPAPPPSAVGGAMPTHDRLGSIDETAVNTAKNTQGGQAEPTAGDTNKPLPSIPSTGAGVASTGNPPLDEKDEDDNDDSEEGDGSTPGKKKLKDRIKDKISATKTKLNH